MTHFKVSQTVQLQKDIVTASPSHCIWSCITVTFFHIPLPLPLLPVFLFTNKPVWNFAVRSYGAWALTAQIPYRRHHSPHCSVHPGEPQAITHPSGFLLDEQCVAHCHFLFWPIFFSLPLLLIHTPILFRAASSWSSFIARKDLCWWFKLDAVLVWPFLQISCHQGPH